MNKIDLDSIVVQEMCQDELRSVDGGGYDLVWWDESKDNEVIGAVNALVNLGIVCYNGLSWLAENSNGAHQSHGM